MTAILGLFLKSVCGFVFDTALGKYLLAGVLAFGTFGIWLWQHDNKIETAAKTEVVATLNTDAEKLKDEALEARAPAARPGAFSRLRRNSCTDCDGEAAVSGR